MSYRIKSFAKTKNKSKYNNRGTEYNGRWYQSKKEAHYAEELDWLVKSGDIKSWVPQYKIEVWINGKHIFNYFVDFKVITKNDTIQFHEVKGFETEVWRLKWNICLALKDELIKEEDRFAEWIVIK